MDKGFKWYALYTRARHERRVENQLKEKGIESYLPMRKVLRRWSDRNKLVEEPLFRSYVFIHTDPPGRYRSVQAYGVVRVIYFNGEPAVVQDKEIENIKRILNEFPQVEAGFPVEVGDTVEVVRGPLTGMQGKLEEIQNEHRLVVLIPSIRQALRINVDLRDIKVIS